MIRSSRIFAEVSQPLTAWQHTLAAAVLLLVGLVVTPSPIGATAHHLLHGLCAQRPSHSLSMNGQLLPFDARMTGIYSGFLVTFVAIVGLRRHHAAGFPKTGPCAILAVFVALMAFDGFNSFLYDANLPHPYVPQNEYRLITGTAAGVALAVAISTLLAMTLWRRPATGKAPARQWWEPIAALVAAITATLLLTNAGPAFYALTCLLLVGSALTVFSGLMLVVSTLVSQKENRFSSAIELDLRIAVSMLLATLVIIGLAAFRYGIESITGVPPLV